jgi:hypothetical protein
VVSAAVGLGFVWVSKSERNPRRGFLARIHIFSGELEEFERPIRLRAPDNVAFGAGALWVTEDVGGLFRLVPSDPRADALPTRIPGDPHGLWAGNSRCVYVATTAPNGYMVFDTGDGRRIGEPYVVGGAREITGGARALWLLGGLGEQVILRVDPERPQKASRIPVPAVPYTDALAAGVSGVWIADGIQTVIRIDPSGRRQPERLTVTGQPIAIALGADDQLVWIAQRQSNEVTAIDPEAGG